MSWLKRRPLFWIAFTGLVAVTLFWGVFAALSGAEEAGGGWRGLLRNAPNAVPWVVALAALAAAYRYPVAVGVLFVLLGIASLILFETYRHIVTFSMISLPYLVFGAMLALSGWDAAD